jgi:hypothetical protein
MKKYQEKLLKVIGDPVEFISRLYIVGKNGRKIKLKPNAEQLTMLDALLKDEDTLVLKGRQIGSSTIVSAYLFWKWYTSSEPVTIAILSHKLNSSKHLLSIHRTFYDNLPDFLKRPLQTDNTTCMSFEDSGASLIAVSAEGKGGLRSFTCSYLHISEYAFAPNPEELKATALSALNDGQLIIETTANYFNDAMHQEIMRHENGTAKWNYLFFPWFSHKNYSSEIPEEEHFILTDYETQLQIKYGLTLEQLYWRRTKEQKLGSKEKFRREYPSSIDDAYAISGNTYLTGEDFENVSVLQIDPKGTTVFDNCNKDDVYAIGVDVAAGVKRDFSVICVVSKLTYQPVLIWRCNETSPVVLAERIVDIAIDYNNALVLVESNNFGNVVLNEMRHMGYYNIWKENGKDWITTRKSKTAMFENLKEVIQRGYIQILDNITYSELRAITVSDKGDIELKEIGGAHSDNAVSLALAYMALEKVRVSVRSFLPDWVKAKRSQKIINYAGISAASKRRY